MREEPTLNDVLNKFSPEIQALAELLRAEVHAVQPGMTEDYSEKLSNIYFRHNGVVCALSLHKQHINLHFYKGVQLSDPAGILEGGGKALRHLKFSSPEEVSADLIGPFVKEAFALNEN